MVLTLSMANFWIYLLLFLALFTLTGVANGSSYRMIPVVFKLSVDPADRVGHERKASSALGLIGSIGAYGGFAIPQILRISNESTGSFDIAFWVFAAGYIALAGLTWFVYMRPGTVFARANV